jgi:hypothetical protein
MSKTSRAVGPLLAEPPSSAYCALDDPLGFDAGDGNFFRYAGNNPANSRDPTGKDDIKELEDHENGAGGTFKWDILCGNPKFKTVTAWFYFVPDKQFPHDDVTFIQVVLESTIGGKPLWSSIEEKAKLEKSLTTDEKKANHLDILPDETDPYYGAMWDGKKWVAEGGSKFGRATNGDTAEIKDTPKEGDARTGAGDVIVWFETAAFCIETQEVLGVLKWGYKIPDSKDGEIELLGGTKKDFSLKASPEFKGLIEKANTVPKIAHAQLNGAAKITEPVKDGAVGGTSALPDKK